MNPRDERHGLVLRRRRDTDDDAQLVTIWRSAVDATHDFLAAEHRDEIEARLVVDYFPQVELYVGERDGTPVAFAGVAGDSLEMLFVDANERGRGWGSALLAFVVDTCGVTRVDVNEQNTQAVEFYRRRGFVPVGRSAVDDEGRPYPILHLSRRVDPAGLAGAAQ